MNEEQEYIEPTEEEIQKAKAQQAGKDVANLAGKAAATYFGGTKGAKMYDMASRTNSGQKILDNAGRNLGNNPLAERNLTKNQSKISQASSFLGGGLNSNSNGLENNDTENSDKKGSISFNSSSDLNKVLNIKTFIKILPIVAASMLIVILCFVFLKFRQNMVGLFYISSETRDSETKKFLSGCGWSTEEQCNAKQQNDFYDEVDKVYDEYKSNYDVELNKELLISTLTYTSPFLTESSDDTTSNLVDYKKNKKQVRELAENMIETYCYLKDENGVQNYVKCDYELTKEEKEKGFKLIEYKVLDEENFRNYLQNTFVINYYLDGKKTEKTLLKAETITNSIYDRVELLKYLRGETEDYSNEIYIKSDIKVIITDCNGNTALEEMTLSEYLKGVVHAYREDSNSIEYIKFLTVTAKNYLYSINGATEDNIPTTLRIKNCESTQLYCSINEGCYYSENGTLMSGSNTNNSYFKEPETDLEFIDSLENIIDEVLNEFLVDENGNVLDTKLTDNNINEALEMSKANKYKDILTNIYGGTITEINVNFIGYPLDINHNEITSLYGWRLHPVHKECRYHNGIDIAAPADSNIYAYESGVVVFNDFGSGYGNYTVIGHGNYDEVNKTYEYYTLYAHQIRLSKYVNVGDYVLAGQLIGSVGSTGTSTGNHLHFEIYTKNNGITNRNDPINYLKNINLTGLDPSIPLYESKNACELANRR